MTTNAQVVADPVGLETYQMVFGKSEDKPLIGLREFTINHLFAKIWSRSRPPVDGTRMITLKQRSMITVALLADQKRVDELQDHIGGARNLGVTEAQIAEIRQPMLFVNDEAQTIAQIDQSMIAVALLATRNADRDVRGRIGQARGLRIADAQLTEIMIHVAHYAGWAAGHHGEDMLASLSHE